MPRSANPVCRPPLIWIPFAFALFGVAIAPQASADFARPPEPSPYEPDGPVEPRRPDEPSGDRHYESDWSDPRAGSASTTLRFHVGPAMLLEPSGPGLFTALDIGQGAVGARLSGAWLRAESDQGLSAYTAELWIDFRHRYELHPILGAGASFVRGGAVGEDENAGAGVLRGTLEYELPIADADARLGLSLMALVPAIGTERTRPWATAALSVGAGF